MAKISTSVLAMLTVSYFAFAKPTWLSEQTLNKSGDSIVIVSDGNGPSMSVARAEALANARNTAANFIKSTFETKTLAVQTESDTSLYSETISNQKVENLDCLPLQEYHEEIDSSYRVWLKVSCNLDASVKASEIQNNENVTNGDSIIEAKTPTAINGEFKKGELVLDSTVLIVSTTPTCERITIRGKRPRTQKCNDNPQRLGIYGDDTQLIFTAKRYRPITLDLKSLDRRPSGLFATERLELIFEK